MWYHDHKFMDFIYKLGPNKRLKKDSLLTYNSNLDRTWIKLKLKMIFYDAWANLNNLQRYLFTIRSRNDLTIYKNKTLYKNSNITQIRVKINNTWELHKTHKTYNQISKEYLFLRPKKCIQDPNLTQNSNKS